MSSENIPQPTLLSDRIGVERDGEEIEVWNSLVVKQHHNVGANSIESHHEILVGDGSTGESPDYITPEMDEQLRALDVYPNAEVVDPRDDDVEVL